jgi:hypothetical protein
MHIGTFAGITGLILSALGGHSSRKIPYRVQSLAIIVLAVAAAVAFGIVHDQITARICIEYFTIGHPRLIDSDSPTVLGLFWGVAATWWVGLPLGLGLAVAARAGRRPKLNARNLLRPVSKLVGSMFIIATVAGLVGFVTARAGIFNLIEPLASRVPREKHAAFLADGWAHAGSYLAGISWRPGAVHYYLAAESVWEV